MGHRDLVRGLVTPRVHNLASRPVKTSIVESPIINSSSAITAPVSFLREVRTPGDYTVSRQS